MKTGRKFGSSIPIIGGFRVLKILELRGRFHSAFDDDLPTREITAFGLVDWNSNPAWNQLSSSLLWSTL